MRTVYRVLANLVAFGVLIQIASIALAWFLALHDIDNGLVIDEDYEGNYGHAIHGIVGIMVIPVLALLLFIVSFFSGVVGGVKWAGFVLLAVVLQVVLAFVSFGLPIVGALHGLNALAVAGLASMAARATKTTPAQESEPAAA